MPNDEYPICNPESKVKDYGKIHFCLVEDINAENDELKEKEKTEKKSENKISGDNIMEKESDINIKNEKDEKEKRMIKLVKILKLVRIDVLLVPSFKS